MKFIDNLLRHHEVDVGKTLGLLSIAGGVISFYKMAGQILAGTRFTLDLGALLGIMVGFALWTHQSWARKFAIVLGWLAVCLFLFIQLSVPFVGNANLTLNVGSETIRHPPEWMIIVWGCIFAPLLFLVLGALHSDTAKDEFKPRPPRFPQAIPDIFHPLLVTLFLAVVCGAALALNNAHTTHGASGTCMNAGSALTPASEAYYHDATRALINHMSASGFTPETPVWKDGQPVARAPGTSYLARKDKNDRVLHVMIYAGPNNANGQIVAEFMITVQYSYFIQGWSWEEENFEKTTAVWTGELRQWWAQYRQTHPTGFRDIADPRS